MPSSDASLAPKLYVAICLMKSADSQISSEAGANKRRGGGPSTRLRYTISKPKPTYPPATSLAGLGMRELTEEEVREAYERRGYEVVQAGEKWFTFEHSGQWREVERQFMGAVRSHGELP
jgi:hypothetical protein